MKVRFLISQISNDPRPIRAGDVLDLSEKEALRYIKAEQAVPYKGDTVERAIIKPREKAVQEKVAVPRSNAPVKKRRRGKNNNRT